MLADVPGNLSIAAAVNSFGSAVTGISYLGLSFTSPRGFRWTSTGGMEDLGTLGGSYSDGVAISSDGLVVVGTSTLPGDTANHAYRWTSAALMQDLGDLGGGYSWAGGVSVDGSVVTGWSIEDFEFGGGRRAFRWTSAGGMQNLGTLGGESSGQAISGDGSVIAGSFSLPEGGGRAFRWTITGGMQNLGVLAGYSSAEGLAISADGSAVVGYCRTADGSIVRAFRWTLAGGMQDLGGTDSRATAVSSDGSTVVGTGSFAKNGAGVVFLWTAELGMIDLSAYLQSVGVDLTGWVLISATGISMDGSAITGTGYISNGQPRAWIVRGLKPQRIYVRANATTGNNNGTSWADALRGESGLQNALAVAGTISGGIDIWVAQGTYHPDETATAPMGTGDRNASFQLLNGVAIYGGFVGNETSLSQRQLSEATETILSGDLAGDDNETSNLNRDENSLNIVNGSNTDASAVLDGFTLRAGNASGTAGTGQSQGAALRMDPGSPTIRNCTFEQNTAFDGGAVYCEGAQSTPTFTNCTFLRNKAIRGEAYTSGGAVESFGASPLFRTCRFEENESNSYGGAIFGHDGGEVAVIKCEFIRNRALPPQGTGGALASLGSTFVVVNSAFLGNMAPSGFACTLSIGSDLAMVNSLVVGNTGNTPFSLGAIYAYEASTYLANCTVAYNSSSHPNGFPGGLYSENSSAPRHMRIENCLLWGNVNSGVASQDAQFNFEVGTYPSEINYSSVQNWTGAGGATGIGNNGSDPEFLRVPSPGPNGTWGDADDNYGDLRPLANSAIDSADFQYVNADTYDIDGDGNVTERTPLDLAGNPRFFDITNVPNTGPGNPPHVDRGAYERVLCDVCPGERLWIDPLGGGFEDIFNWTLGVPGIGKPAGFNLNNALNKAYTVAFGMNHTNAAAAVRAGYVTWDLNPTGLSPKTYTLNLQFNPPLAPGSPQPPGGLVVGDTAATPASLSIIGGTVNATGAVIGFGAAADGGIDVGAGSLLRSGPNLIVGSFGDASLLIHDGGVVTATTGTIGQFPGSSGLVTITGAGSRLSFLASCNITRGTIHVGPGGTLRTGALGALILEEGNITGSGTIIGSVINIGDITPGDPPENPGTLTITRDFIQFSDDPKFGNGSGTLMMEIAGEAVGQHDLLDVHGSATLGGGLIVMRSLGFGDPITQPIEVLSAAGGVSGFFDVAFLPSARTPVDERPRFLRAQTQPSLRGAPAMSESVFLTAEVLAALILNQPGSTQSLSGTPASAVAGDFDGINGPDVAVVIPNQANPTGANGDLVILLNTGPPLFDWTTVQMNGAVGRNPSDIAAAEFDGQPGLDLVVSEASDNTVSVLRNLGGGGAFLSRQTFNVGTEPRGVAAGDLDSDTFADVAVANATSGTISILRNQQSTGGPGGTWLGLGQSLGNQRIDINADPSVASPRPVDVALVQLNAEVGFEVGAEVDLEVVSVNEGSSNVTVVANAASAAAIGGWAARWNFPPIRIPTPDPSDDIQPTNPDEDKWEDIVISSRSAGTVGIILNDRADPGEPMDPPALIKFRPAVAVPLQTGDTSDADPSSLVAADLDNDGDDDLAIAAFNEAGVRTVIVLRNDAPTDGTVTLSRDADLVAGNNPRVVISANVDSDPENREDLIVLNGSTALARGASNAESRVLLNTPPPCEGDANNDRVVNFADITKVLENWGLTGPPRGPGDADGDGDVNFTDITAALTSWGANCM